MSDLRTPICDLFDIEVPIFLAGMGGVAFAEVCAAVSEAGGYGTLGMAGASPEQLREQILADGCHVERTPLYHAVALQDLMETEALRNGLSVISIDESAHAAAE